MFQDRAEAGARLAARLDRHRGADGVVLALPRGGAPVAAPIARALGMPLDLAFVRKVGLPGRPELAVAAIAGGAGEELVVNEDVAQMVGLDRAQIEALAGPERAELVRRRDAYGAPALPLSGRVAIIVDDGVATGATVRAAAQALRRRGPARLILATPVASDDTLSSLAPLFDEIECLESPRPLRAVSDHYARFPQVSDQEVREALLARSAQAKPRSRPRT